MISLKRAIAAFIVCFKPQCLLTLCILLVIAQSIVIAIQKGAPFSIISGSRRDTNQDHDHHHEQQQQSKSELTFTMTTIVLVVALIWASFFISVIRYELRNEIESLLILFQSSKRGLRFLGVVFFHIGFLILVTCLVSSAVERSANLDVTSSDNDIYEQNQINFKATRQEEIVDNRNQQTIKLSTGLNRYNSGKPHLINRASGESYYGKSNINKSSKSILSDDRVYLKRVYKIWLTSIVYAFLYLIIENVVMIYEDMTLIEFIHGVFLKAVAKLTGIDLSDYPAGEMLINPLVRRILR